MEKNSYSARLACEANNICFKFGTKYQYIFFISIFTSLYTYNTVFWAKTTPYFSSPLISATCKMELDNPFLTIAHNLSSA